MSHFLVWHDMVRNTSYTIVYVHGVVWYGMLLYDMFDIVCYGKKWYSIQNDMLWHDMVWYGMTLYGMLWHDMIWYTMNNNIPQGGITTLWKELYESKAKLVEGCK